MSLISILSIIITSALTTFFISSKSWGFGCVSLLLFFYVLANING